MAEKTSLETITLNGELLRYRLTRVPRRRSVAINVDAQGVWVRAPYRVAHTFIEATLFERAAWVATSLAWYRKHHRQLVSPDWRDGASVWYRGLPLILAVRQTNQESIRPANGQLQVSLRDVSACRLEQIVYQWWWQEAQRELFALAYSIAKQANAFPKQLALSKARRRWGSCNSLGTIRLNWRLILLPPQLALDVVAHEVAHLKVMNHSPAFWAWAEKLSPDIRSRKREMAEWGGLLTEDR